MPVFKQFYSLSAKVEAICVLLCFIMSVRFMWLFTFISSPNKCSSPFPSHVLVSATNDCCLLQLWPVQRPKGENKNMQKRCMKRQLKEWILKKVTRVLAESVSGKFSCHNLLLHLWNPERVKEPEPEQGSEEWTPGVGKEVLQAAVSWGSSTWVLKCGTEMGSFLSITAHPCVYPSAFRSLERDKQKEPHVPIKWHFYRGTTGHKVCKKPIIQKETSASNWYPLVCMHQFILGLSAFQTAPCLSQ